MPRAMEAPTFPPNCWPNEPKFFPTWRPTSLETVDIKVEPTCLTALCFSRWARSNSFRCAFSLAAC